MEVKNHHFHGASIWYFKNFPCVFEFNLAVPGTGVPHSGRLHVTKEPKLLLNLT